MDLESFAAFTEFLTKTEESARDQGFRFRGIAYFPVSLHPFLESFAKSLVEAPEFSPLKEQLNRAILLCESEAIRKVMIVTCKELGAWPTGSEASDFDTPLEQTAYALWLHQKSLEEDEIILGRHKQRTMTAFYIVDFAHAAGVAEAGETTEGGQKMLNDFLKSAKISKKSKNKIRNSLLETVESWAPKGVQKEVENFLESNANTFFVGAAAFAAGAIVAGLLNLRKR